MNKTEYPAPWTERVGKFADAVGVDIEKITECLAGVVGDPGEEALGYLSDPKATPEPDLRKAFEALSIPSGKMNSHISKLRGEQPVVADANDKNSLHALSILPSLPDDDSFIAMLRVGGELKVGKTEVLSAVKAGLAKRIGLYDFPATLLQKMEEFADKQEEPCAAEFFEVQKMLTEKKYGDILSIINVSRSFVSEARKKTFLAKLDEFLWDALKSFHTQLNVWQKTWIEGASNPAIIMMMMGNAGGALPAGMAEPPDTTPVRTSGEEVVNMINKVFAGPGIPVARAMAYDATTIIGIINEPKILAQAGYATKDQMLKDLGIGIGSEMIRLEQNVTRYTLAIMSLPEVKADDELMYLTALVRLDGGIPWDKLDGKGIGGRNLRG